MQKWMRKISPDFGEKFIYLYYYRIPEHFKFKTIFSLISTFPIRDQERFYKIQDRNAQQRALFGNIIVRHIAFELALEVPAIIHTSPTGKPYFSSSPSIDYNISHSGKIVVCCFTKNSSIGIDVEQIRPVTRDIYQEYFQPDEWQFIDKSDCPEQSFFNLWVRKEALIKADGRGMEISLSSLKCLNNRSEIAEKTWHIQDVELDENYSCAIACAKEKPIKLLNFNKLFSIESFGRSNHKIRNTYEES